jgi:hypothetical protein
MSRGFGFVKYCTAGATQRARRELHGRDVPGAKRSFSLKVEFAKEDLDRVAINNRKRLRARPTPAAASSSVRKRHLGAAPGGLDAAEIGVGDLTIEDGAGMASSFMSKNAQLVQGGAGARGTKRQPTSPARSSNPSPVPSPGPANRHGHRKRRVGGAVAAAAVGALTIADGALEVASTEGAHADRERAEASEGAFTHDGGRGAGGGERGAPVKGKCAAESEEQEGAGGAGQSTGASDAKPGARRTKKGTAARALQQTTGADARDTSSDGAGNSRHKRRDQALSGAATAAAQPVDPDKVSPDNALKRRRKARQSLVVPCEVPAEAAADADGADGAQRLEDFRAISASDGRHATSEGGGDNGTHKRMASHCEAVVGASPTADTDKLLVKKHKRRSSPPRPAPPDHPAEKSLGAIVSALKLEEPAERRCQLDPQCRAGVDAAAVPTAAAVPVATASEAVRLAAPADTAGGEASGALPVGGGAVASAGAMLGTEASGAAARNDDDSDD